MEEAFDSAEHEFIFAALKRFGFGEQFIQWVKTLWTDAQSCVNDNGFSTGYFKINRGDILSPYLHVLAREILFIQEEVIKIFEDLT